MRFIASRPTCRGALHAVSPGCQYQIAWEINPHMIVGSVHPERAVAQHAALVRAVRSLGIDLQMLPFVHAAFDSVFCKDNGIFIRDRGTTRALLARPRFSERQQEQAVRAADLVRAGIELHPDPADLEGGDVIVIPGRCALLGHGFRSYRAAAPALERFLGLPVLPVELVDPALYHLDTAIAALADGTLLVCDEALAPGARRELNALGLGEVFSVSRDEAVRFALNLVEIGDAIVTGTESAEVRAILATRGKRVVYTPLDEFHRAGGSVACLLAPVHDQQAVATAATTAIRSTAA
ncbi:MAG: arginine deiminase-related protein [Kofleriaceae bacterium]